MVQKSVLMILGFCVLAAADTTTGSPVSATTTEHVMFAPGGTIRLDDASGYVTVEGWDKNEVEITVVKSVGFDSGAPERANARLEGVRVAAERRSVIVMDTGTT